MNPSRPSSRLRLALPVWLLFVALCAAAAAQSAGQIVVYHVGRVLEFDPSVGAELKEAVLETYDCGSGELVKKETIEVYFHLSEDNEIITPEAITEACHAVFRIEKRGDKYFFRGVREKPVENEEELARAAEAAPAPSPEEAVRSIEEKVRRVAREIVKIDPAKKGSSVQRERIINAEFTTSLSGFDTAQLEKVAGYVLSEPGLSPSQKYYVLRSFGFVFYRKGDYPKAIFFYDKCTELLPDRYSAWLQRAVAEQRAKHDDAAIRSYVKALEIVAGRGGRTADSVLRRFRHFLEERTVTEQLGTGQIEELRGQLSAIGDTLARGDRKEAQRQAHELAELVASWYAGAPSTQPDAPGDDNGF
ncbi:MAG: tetratricopeptide repeat protein [Planctomycetota bacterium]|nr:MAG: tetratricopeptide repeat protein [Planctomycetota bacterium]